MGVGDEGGRRGGGGGEGRGCSALLSEKQMELPADLCRHAPFVMWVVAISIT